MELRWSFYLLSFFLLSPIFTTKENETEIEKIKSNHFPGNEEKVKHRSARKRNQMELKISEPTTTIWFLIETSANESKKENHML